MPPPFRRYRGAWLLAVGGLILAAAMTASPCRRPTRTLPADGRPLILCAGDSITAAGYPDHLRARLEHDGFRVRVENAGRKGNTTGEYLAFLRSSRLAEREKPAVVLLQLGTNDVRIDGDRTPVELFRRNLEAIIDLFMARPFIAGRVPVILLATIPAINVVDMTHFDANSDIRVEKEINPTIRDIARRRGIALIDNHALFAGRPSLLPDIHPSEEGYRALADNWHASLAPLLATIPGAR